MKFIANMYVVTIALLSVSGAVCAASATKCDGATPTVSSSASRYSSGSLTSIISTRSCADVPAVHLSPQAIKGQDHFAKGVSLLLGVNGETQSDLAAVWSFERAVRENYPWAKVYLSLCCLTDRGMLMPGAFENKARASDLLRSAESSGDKEASLWASYMLGECFETSPKWTKGFGRDAVVVGLPKAAPKGISPEGKQFTSLWTQYFGDRYAKFVHDIRP